MSTLFQTCSYTYSSYDGIFPLGWYDENLNAANPQLGPGEAGLFWVPDLSIPINWVRSEPCRADVAITQPQRTGTNLLFRFAGAANQGYAVLRCTNLSERTWHVVQSGTSTSALASITVDASAGAGGFYRVIPAGQNILLVNPARSGSSFSFEFCAPASTTYTVLKKTDLAQSSWNTVVTVTSSSNSFVRVTDTSAGAARGYYTVRTAVPPN